MSQNNGNYIKILFLGDSGIGKTSFVRNLIFKQNDSTSTAIVEDFVETDQEVTINQVIAEKNVSLHDVGTTILDLSVSEEYKQSFYSGTHFIFLLYDITSAESFRSVKTRWYPEVMKYAPYSYIMMIGTKADCAHKRQVGIKDAESFAGFRDILFMEISNKQGTNLDLTYRILYICITKFMSPTIPPEEAPAAKEMYEEVHPLLVKDQEVEPPKASVPPLRLGKVCADELPEGTTKSDVDQNNASNDVSLGNVDEEVENDGESSGIMTPRRRRLKENKSNSDMNRQPASTPTNVLSFMHPAPSTPIKDVKNSEREQKKNSPKNSLPEEQRLQSRWEDSKESDARGIVEDWDKGEDEEEVERNVQQEIERVKPIQIEKREQEPQRQHIAIPDTPNDVYLERNPQSSSYQPEADPGENTKIISPRKYHPSYGSPTAHNTPPKLNFKAPGGQSKPRQHTKGSPMVSQQAPPSLNSRSEPSNMNAKIHEEQTSRIQQKDSRPNSRDESSENLQQSSYTPYINQQTTSASPKLHQDNPHSHQVQSTNQKPNYLQRELKQQPITQDFQQRHNIHTTPYSSSQSQSRDQAKTNTSTSQSVPHQDNPDQKAEHHYTIQHPRNLASSYLTEQDANRHHSSLTHNNQMQSKPNPSPNHLRQYQGSSIHHQIPAQGDQHSKPESPSIYNPVLHEPGKVDVKPARKSLGSSEKKKVSSNATSPSPQVTPSIMTSPIPMLSPRSSHNREQKQPFASPGTAIQPVSLSESRSQQNQNYSPSSSYNSRSDGKASVYKNDHQSSAFIGDFKVIENLSQERVSSPYMYPLICATSKIPQLFLLINISDGRIGQIGVCFEDNPQLLAEMFTKYFDLHPDNVKFLSNIVRYTINKYMKKIQQEKYKHQKIPRDQRKNSPPNSNLSRMRKQTPNTSGYSDSLSSDYTQMSPSFQSPTRASGDRTQNNIHNISNNSTHNSNEPLTPRSRQGRNLHGDYRSPTTASLSYSPMVSPNQAVPSLKPTVSNVRSAPLTPTSNHSRKMSPPREYVMTPYQSSKLIGSPSTPNKKLLLIMMVKFDENRTELLPVYDETDETMLVHQFALQHNLDAEVELNLLQELIKTKKKLELKKKSS